MGILDAPVLTSLAQSPLVAAQGISVVGWWDADDIPGADSAAVSTWPERSGNGRDLVQFTGANQPTLKKNQVNGHACIRTGAAGFVKLAAAGFGPYAQPTVTIAVMKAAVVASTRVIVGGDTGQQNTFLDSTKGTVISNAGTSISGAGRVDDSAWHIVASRFDTFGENYVDGIISGYGTAVGAASMTGVAIGAKVDGTFPANMDIACAIVISGRPTKTQLSKLFAYLATRYAITIGPQETSVNAEDTTSSNGQSVRIWMPSGFVAASAPLIMLSHSSGSTYQYGPGGFLYPFIQAFLDQGWPVISPNAHGDNWGSQTGINDMYDAYLKMAGRYTIPSVILVAASMGGLISSLAKQDGQLPNIKGVIATDAVFNLASMYSNASFTSLIDTAYGITRGTISATMGSTGVTSVPTTASFPTIGTQLMLGNGTANVETVTTTGASSGTAVAVTATTKTHASADQVSDYPTKTVGHDPVLRAAGDFTAIRWRFYASPDDVVVPKTTNTDQFRTLIAAAPELGLVTTVGAHLDPSHTPPGDAVAFVKRCI